MDTKNSLYNELIIKINNTRLEYDKAIKLINDKGVINLKNINPSWKSVTGSLKKLTSRSFEIQVFLRAHPENFAEWSKRKIKKSR